MFKGGLCLLLVFFLSINFSVQATHIKAGDISVKQKICNEGTFIITLSMYGNTSSPIEPGSGSLNFGDGSVITTPSRSFITRPDLGDGIGVYFFSAEHTYSQGGTYTISYSEPNRNAGILNIQNSVSTPFFIDTKIIFDKSICNNSPVLLSPPIDRACSALAFFHNPAAFDQDGDSLSFELTVPMSSRSLQATYLAPNHPSFYASDFNTGNEMGNEQPQFLIDALTGTIVWDAPGAVGEYNIAFIVNEWRKINDVFVKLSSVRRDMQILVEECNNKRPDIIIPQDVCIYPGTLLEETILGSDPNNHDVKIEVFSGIFSLPNNPATFLPKPSDFQPSTPNASLAFQWTPNCSEVRNQPYQVTVKITDNPPNGPRLVRFKTWNIKVAAPPPVLSLAEVDILQKKAKIEWSPYLCSNATKIQIWRRVGSFAFNPDNCVSGLPKFAGYSKIGEVGPDITQFVDDNNGLGLDVGAVFCYRLTALFPLVGGAESKVSIELCLPPILADAPVITNVSVANTDAQLGEMIISWKRPYDLSQSDYVKPYEYALYRGKGLTGDEGLLKITSSNVLDTTFTDTGLNTRDFGYNYRIVLLARTSLSSNLIPVDTSSAASSVWNVATPKLKSISLNWEAITPWTNSMQDNPMHLVYRYDESSQDKNLILIDSVNVLENGFNYLDEGIFQGRGLNDSEFYCYRIKTRGTYGNSAIQSPIENFSQVICSTTLDTTPPCKPELVQAVIDCDLFNSQTPCSQKIFSNTIKWLEPIDDSCKKDIYRYHVYGSNSSAEEFNLLGSVSVTEFVETGLTRLARCYKIIAVDRAGNESEVSEVMCYDNCPSVFIPNVFTPNGDDYNERFELFEVDQACSRFIDKIMLSVYNIWGQIIVSIQNEGSLLWDGNDAFGKPVPSGVYYFNADVQLDTLDPSKNAKQIKGWIHIVH